MTLSWNSENPKKTSVVETWVRVKDAVYYAVAKRKIFFKVSFRIYALAETSFKPYFVAHFNENSQAWMLNPHMSQAAFLQGATTETTP